MVMKKANFTTLLLLLLWVEFNANLSAGARLLLVTNTNDNYVLIPSSLTTFDPQHEKIGRPPASIKRFFKLTQRRLSRSTHSPGVGHMQIRYSPTINGVLKSRHSHGVGHMQVGKGKRVLKSVLSPGVALCEDGDVALYSLPKRGKYDKNGMDWFMNSITHHTLCQWGSRLRGAYLLDSSPLLTSSHGAVCGVVALLTQLAPL
eukprot:Gb_22640 [translate_table: standard]